MLDVSLFYQSSEIAECACFVAMFLMSLSRSFFLFISPCAFECICGVNEEKKKHISINYTILRIFGVCWYVLIGTECMHIRRKLYDGNNKRNEPRSQNAHAYEIQTKNKFVEFFFSNIFHFCVVVFFSFAVNFLLVEMHLFGDLNVAYADCNFRNVLKWCWSTMNDNISWWEMTCM